MVSTNKQTNQHSSSFTTHPLVQSVLLPQQPHHGSENTLSLSYRQKARRSQKPKPSADSMTPPHTLINSGACWAAGEWAMSYYRLLNPVQHRATGTRWDFTSHSAPLVNVSKSVELPTKYIFNCIWRYTLKILSTCLCAQVCTNTDTHTLSQSLSLPRVSSFALSRSLCEEGPNFSLISFIKRCGEERRKRRGGEGETQEKNEARGWD